MNAKLEAVLLKTADGINEMGILAEVHLEAIDRLLQKELETLESDLAIAQASRELVAWEKENHFAGMTRERTPIEWYKKVAGVRTAVEKANTLTPRSADAPTAPAVQ